MGGFRDAGIQRPLNRRLGEVLGGVGVSTLGNTAGTTGTVFGPAVLVGVSGVSLSQSTQGQQATISIIASAENGVAIGAGTQTASTGTVVFSNSNNVTFGLSGQTLTASAGGGGPSISAGTQLATSGTVVFSNSNGVSFGLSNSSVLTASVTREPSIAAGTQTGSTGTIVFSNSNGITFGMSGSSQVTASASAISGVRLQAGTGTIGYSPNTIIFQDSNGYSWGTSNVGGLPVITINGGPGITFWDASAAGELAAVSAEVTRLLFQRVNIPNQLLATRAQLMLNISNSNSAGGTVAFSFGVYTMSGSTASLASSASRTFAYNSTLAGSSYTDLNGTRYRSMTLGTWSLTPGDYLLALQFRLTTALTSGSYSWIGGHNLSVDGFDYGTATSVGYFNHGKLSVSTAAFPATIGPGDIKGAAFDNAQFFPYIQLVGTF